MKATQWKQRKCVGDGWMRELVLPFLTMVEAACPDVEINDIKEKFGTLRIYAAGPEWLFNVERVFESASEQCCEDCGLWHGEYDDRTNKYAIVAEGPIFPDGGWIKTLCYTCRDIRQKEDERKLAESKLAESGGVA